MAVQQCKVSKQKCRARKSANKYQGLETNKCPNCQAPRLPHRVCTECGHYKGRQVLSITSE
jgi:large subunit ribosomal protein L32